MSLRVGRFSSLNSGRISVQYTVTAVSSYHDIVEIKTTYLRPVPLVWLQYMPAYILVKLDRTRATRLPGLDEQVIPIEPLARTFEIRTKMQGKMQTKKIVRRQLPMTAAYAFTDYQAQGQTIPYVTVDIKTPPRGGLSLFNLYVALSRSSGRATIRLLRDFDDELVLQAHPAPVLDEDDRLEGDGQDNEGVVGYYDGRHYGRDTVGVWRILDVAGDCNVIT